MIDQTIDEKQLTRTVEHARERGRIIHTIEQQGKTFDEIQAQWHEPEYWTGITSTESTR